MLNCVGSLSSSKFTTNAIEMPGIKNPNFQTNLKGYYLVQSWSFHETNALLVECDLAASDDHLLTPANTC